MLILTAVVDFGSDYGKDTSQIVGGSMSLSNFNDSISNFQTDAQKLQDRFAQRSIWTQVAGIVLVGIMPLAMDMFEIIFAPFKILTNILVDVIGVPAWVTSIVIGLFIIGIIFGAWRLLKVGE